MKLIILAVGSRDVSSKCDRWETSLYFGIDYCRTDRLKVIVLDVLLEVLHISEMLPHRTHCSELRSAILDQDVKTVERLLDQGADVHDADPIGITLLHIASTKNFANIVQILISHGASVNRRSHERTNCYTPLHYAVEGGHEEIVKILLSNKADVHLCTKVGMSPLDIAVERKYVDIARVLLSHGASVNSPSCPTYRPPHEQQKNYKPNYLLWKNYQPLHRAVGSGHDELVKLLLDSGADVNADAVAVTDTHSGVRPRLANEWTPLHIAAEKGYMSITKTLLEHGANVNAGKYGQLISPLCVAMEEASSIDELLIYLKDPENKKREIGDTKYEIITNLLLEHGAVFVPEVDVFQAGLHGAVKMGNTTTVECILKSFPDAIDSLRNVRERNCTLLHTAADFWNVKSVEFLIRHGANVNAKDNRGQTPIFYVVNEKDEILMDAAEIRGDDLRTAELLLSNGANVDCRDNYMQTPLHHAVENGNYEMVNFLLMHNACVESHVESVMSPLHVAVYRKNAQIAEVLLNNGARINSVCFESCESSYNLNDPDSDAESQGSLDHCPSSTSDVSNCPSDREPRVFFNSRSATPLDCAVGEGREEFVKLLLTKMISADANSVNNSTPLCSAINNGVHRIVKLLLDHGFYINVDDIKIKRALFMTVRGGFIKTLEYIFKIRPDVNVIVDNKGRTLWHYAVMYSTFNAIDVVTATKVAELLIKHGCDLNALDDDGKTPLLHALESITFCTDHHLDTVKYLLEHGARVDPTDENLQTMIRRFIEYERCTLIELLLKYCSDVKVLLHANGTHLLCTAIEFGCTEVVRLLIKYGANVNVTNKSGKNALHLATREAPEAVEMLIESGADVDRRDEGGETALHIAASPGCGESSSRVMTVLLKYRADVNITSNDNFTALDHALRRFPRDDKTRILLTKHLIKMKAANLFVNEHDLQSIGSCVSYNDLYNSCKAECEEMRKRKVADTSLCFYDLLTGINYARNESVVKSLESRDYETEFPLYYGWIKNNFKRAQKRVPLLTRSATFLNSLLGYELPEIVTMKILSYLTDCDLQNLIETYSNDTSQKLYEMETNGKITIIKKNSG